MRIALSAAVMLLAAPLSAQSNPQVDYPGFVRLTDEVLEYRNGRLVAFSQFMEEARKPGALLLDARSRDAFNAGHIEGAVNLPLTEFTAESLAEVVGPDRNRPIYIYCNNNFSNGTFPIPTKQATLALNIQTFINLVGYDYPNVWEMGDIVNATDPEVEWVGELGYLTGALPPPTANFSRQ